MEMIKKYAKELEIFPIEMLASHPDGPIAKRCPKAFWKTRYELTFQQYQVFFTFISFAVHVTEKDIDDMIACLDDASIKEKSLILTALFLYERLHRKPPKRYDLGTTFWPHHFWENNKIPPKRWVYLSSIIRKYASDLNMAYPAVTTDEKQLKKLWEKDRENSSARLKSLGILLDEAMYSPRLEQTESGPVFKITTIHDILSAYQNKLSPAEFQEAEALLEYLCLPPPIAALSGSGNFNVSWRPLSGIAPEGVDGNSSSQPKTLGEIATQLLLSRLPYEEEK